MNALAFVSLGVWATLAAATPDDDTVLIIDDETPAATAADPTTPPPVNSESDDIIIIDQDATDSPKTVTTPCTEEPSPSAPPQPAERTWLKIDYISRAAIDTNFETRTGEDVIEWWNLGTLRLDYKSDTGLHAVVEGRARWGVVAQDTRPATPFVVFNATQPKWTGEVELREGYIAFELGGIDLKVGQRLFVWGKNEIYSPADTLNPRDLRFDLMQSLRSTKDSKIPLFAIDASYAIGDTNLELVAAPFFTGHKVSLYGRDFALAAPGSAYADQLRRVGLVHPSIEDELHGSIGGTEMPEQSFENTTWAARVSTRLAGWDLAATAIWGFDRTPRVVIDPDLVTLLEHADDIARDPRVVFSDPALRAAALRLDQKAELGVQLLSGTYARQWLFALEAEGTVGDLVLRADVGFSPEQAWYDTDVHWLRRPTLSGALGAEYTRGQEWYIAVTALTFTVFDAPKTVRLIGLEPSTLNPQNRDVAALCGVATTVRYLWEAQNIELSAAGVFSFAPGDAVVFGEVVYKDFEPHQFKLGTVFFWGQDGGVAYEVRNNSFVYLEYQGTW